MMYSDNHIFAGLQQDVSISKHPAHLLCDALNIRMTAREGQTALSLTNEKGPQLLSFDFKYYNGSEWATQAEWDDKAGENGDFVALTSIEGTYIGHCVLNNYVVIFTHIDSTHDAIYRMDMAEKRATRIYLGNLGLSVDCPIQALVSYENENIQKVYWTDNKNQPRIINIAPSEDMSKLYIEYNDDGEPAGIDYNNQILDFSPELALNEQVSVTKQYSGGTFAPGVIQYAITYYNKHAQETAIAVVTPLYYISPYGRGGSPEESCNNSFTITVSNVDRNFEYLRIYSIQRTSLNGTPICKRLQDIKIGNQNTLTYVDTGTNGDIVDPTSLLFLGGEEIKAEAICQKDGSLFLGNITLERPSLTFSIKSSLEAYFSTNRTTPYNTTSSSHLEYEQRECKCTRITTSGDFPYASTLVENCAGFKKDEYYRLGVQFQYKTGVWSEPVWIMDHKIVKIGNGSATASNSPTLQMGTYSGSTLIKQEVPFNSIIKTKIDNVSIINSLKELGYKKVRPIIAHPSLINRTIILQGVYNRTMYRNCDRYGSDPNSNTPSYSNMGHLHAQASWIFRPLSNKVFTEDWIADDVGGVISGSQGGALVSLFSDTYHNNIFQPYMYSTEIQGLFPVNSEFKAEDEPTAMGTINSPDILWDTDVRGYSFSSNIKVGRVAYAKCNINYGDIDITTSSGTIGGLGAGFVHRPIRTQGDGALLSQPAYQDSLVDDFDNNSYGVNQGAKYPVLWPIYMWQRNGSLNNDVNRSGRSAMLQTKKISNYKTADRFNYGKRTENYKVNDVKIFSLEEVQYIKVGGKPYMGNIDTLLVPKSTGFYFSGNPQTSEWETEAVYSRRADWRLQAGLRNGTTDVGLLSCWNYETKKWKDSWKGSPWVDFGDKVPALGSTRDGVRMKYKSTPHAVIYGDIISLTDTIPTPTAYIGGLPIVEVFEPYNADTLYGGTSTDAMKAIQWIPAGPAVNLSTGVYIKWTWGDTFFNRWECLKTYAFTKEDQNQVVDILSFPVESHINLDGRYDRNRGQSSNLNMSPQNYNLMNPVYSQLDNFFSYRIMDEDYYKLNQFSNQVTWTSEKTQGADVDNWTNVTLASTYDLDGSKGQVRVLRTWKDTIYCFQDTGISQLIFNPRVQIPTSDNVPIEIGNSYKMEGKRYLTESIGCINPSSVCETPLGLYFLDSVSRDLYMIGGNGLTNLADKCNMVTWFNEVPSEKWKPSEYTSKVFYDQGNQDVYISTSAKTLCFSEKLAQFTSFMSYQNIAAMFSVGPKFYTFSRGVDNITIWSMFDGVYNKFFNTFEPFSISFISNANSASDKTFLNLEAQADFYDTLIDSDTEPFKHRTNPINSKSLNPKKFFDTIRVQTEYQDTGVVPLTWKNFRSFGNSSSYLSSNAAKKFRIWRVEIPRDKSDVVTMQSLTKKPKLFDRIRNTWAKVTLTSNPQTAVATPFMEFHNVSIQYYV